MKGKTNIAPLDRWTVIHAGAGALAGVTGLPFIPTMIAAVAYEGLERVFESNPESAPNVAADLGVFALGFAAARPLHAKTEQAVSVLEVLTG